MPGPSTAPLFRGRSIWRRSWEYDEPTLFFFFLVAVMVLGVLSLCSYHLMAAWHVSWPCITPRSAEGFSVLVKPISFPMFFEALPF